MTMRHRMRLAIHQHFQRLMQSALFMLQRLTVVVHVVVRPRWQHHAADVMRHAMRTQHFILGADGGIGRGNDHAQLGATGQDIGAARDKTHAASFYRMNRALILP